MWEMYTEAAPPTTPPKIKGIPQPHTGPRANIRPGVGGMPVIPMPSPADEIKSYPLGPDGQYPDEHPARRSDPADPNQRKPIPLGVGEPHKGAPVLEPEPAPNIVEILPGGGWRPLNIDGSEMSDAEITDYKKMALSAGLATQDDLDRIRTPEPEPEPEKETPPVPANPEIIKPEIGPLEKPDDGDFGSLDREEAERHEKLLVMLVTLIQQLIARGEAPEAIAKNSDFDKLMNNLPSGHRQYAQKILAKQGVS